MRLDNPGWLSYHRHERSSLFSGGIEIALLLFIAFLLFGPKKLPEIARVLGKGLAELRRASNELRSSLEQEIQNLERETETHLNEPSEPVSTYGHDNAETHMNEPSEPVSTYGHDNSEPASEELKPRT